MTIKDKAREYSFGIESKLFPTLDAGQQKLWKAEIEQAFIAGASHPQSNQVSVQGLTEFENTLLGFVAAIDESGGIDLTKDSGKTTLRFWANRLIAVIMKQFDEDPMLFYNATMSNQALRTEYEKGRYDGRMEMIGKACK